MKEDIQSENELHFSWFLEELKEKEYIKEYTLQPPAFELSKEVSYTWIQPKPTKKEPKRIDIKYSKLLAASEYTPDCKIVWTDKALGVFCIPVPQSNKCRLFICHDNISYIEVKPIRDFKNMTRLFITKQKWIYQLYSIYINLAIPEKLFSNMFTPQRYLIQNKTKQPRKIKFKTRTLKEYINNYEEV